MSSAYLFSILATAAIFTLLALSLNIITWNSGQTGEVMQATTIYIDKINMN